MKFDELAKLADKVSKKAGLAVNISVSYWRFIRTDRKELECSFYLEDAKKTICFDTALKLKNHMENILNPVEDEGIEINDLARGAE